MRFHFHRWEKWRVYVRRYRMPIGGEDFPCSQTRERRSCKVCGMSQDRVVCDGEEDQP